MNEGEDEDKAKALEEEKHASSAVESDNNLFEINFYHEERATDNEVRSMIISDGNDNESDTSMESCYRHLVESKFEVLSKTCSVYRWNIEQFQCKLFSGLDLFSMPFKLSPSIEDSSTNTFELKMSWFNKRKDRIKVELLENGINNTQRRFRVFITCEGNGFLNSQPLTANALDCDPFFYVNYITVDVTEACSSKTIANFIENDTLFMNCYFEFM